MISPMYIMLGIGAVGLLLVLVFSISSGVGNRTLPPTLAKTGVDQCGAPVPKPVRRNEVVKKSSYTLSDKLAAGACPTGYTNFNDVYGNYLCCASTQVDPYSHSCSAKGADGVCAMAPGIEDTRNVSGDVRHYPLCQSIARQQQAQMSGKLCPRRYPNYAPVPGGAVHKCCAGPLSPSGTDCTSTQLCTSLSAGQTVFNTPTSCEKELLLEKLQCPPGTNLVPNMKGTSSKTKDITMPICVGLAGNCFPRDVLVKFREAGFLLDIDIDKNVLNCDIFNKVYNERIMNESQVETTQAADLS